MQPTIGVAKAEYQGGLRAIAGNADHDAVGCALPLHLHPFPLPWQIPTVATLGDDSLQTGHKCQPLLGELDGFCLSHELEVCVPGPQQYFEAISPMAQRLIDKFGSSIPHQVKCEQDRG